MVRSKHSASEFSKIRMTKMSKLKVNSQFPVKVDFFNQTTLGMSEHSEESLETLMQNFWSQEKFTEIKAHEYNVMVRFFINISMQKEDPFGLKELIQNLIQYVLTWERQNQRLVNITTKLMRSFLEIEAGFFGDFILSEMDEE